MATVTITSPDETLVETELATDEQKTAPLAHAENHVANILAAVCEEFAEKLHDPYGTWIAWLKRSRSTSEEIYDLRRTPRPGIREIVTDAGRAIADLFSELHDVYVDSM